jgi:hypothetical protein
MSTHTNTNTMYTEEERDYLSGILAKTAKKDVAYKKSQSQLYNKNNSEKYRTQRINLHRMDEIAAAVALDPDLNHLYDDNGKHIPQLIDNDEPLALIMWEIARLPKRCVDIHTINDEYLQKTRVQPTQYIGMFCQNGACTNGNNDQGKPARKMKSPFLNYPLLAFIS